jgi:hypothetical protein
MVIFQVDMANRMRALTDSLDNGERDRVANRVYEKVAEWRKWLADNLSPNLTDAEAPERDVLKVADKLNDIPLEKEIVQFFDDWVHDSMAGLAKDSINEYLINGIGLAKFRRIYFGNRGDAMLHEAAKKLNDQHMKTAKARQAEREKWKAESDEYARMTGRSY